MLTRSRLLLAASAIVVAAPFVRAADTPVLDKLDREEIKKGSLANVRAVGSNFGDKIDDVTVTAGGSDCKVTEVTDKSLRFQMPNTLALGPVSITIKVRGTSLSAKLKVVDKLTGGAFNQGKEGNADQLVARPQLDTKLTLQGGDSASAVLEGTTQIPVGLMLEIQFILAGMDGDEDQVIETKKFKLDKPQFKVVFGPFPGKTFVVGKYCTYTEFLLERANVKDLQTAHWDKLTKPYHDAYAKIWSRDTKDWGSPEDTKKETDEVRAHYTELLKSTSAVLDVLEKSYGAAGKCYARKATGSGYDEDDWVKWLHERNLGNNDDELKKLKADTRFVNSGGAFVADKWQLWLEKEIWKPLSEQRASHDSLHNKYVGVKNSKMDLEGYELISIVGKLAQTYSTEIYTRSRLDIPEAVRNPKGILEGHEPPVATHPAFDTKKQVLQERLDKIAASAPAAKPSDKPGK